MIPNDTGSHATVMQISFPPPLPDYYTRLSSPTQNETLQGEAIDSLWHHQSVPGGPAQPQLQPVVGSPVYAAGPVQPEPNLYSSPYWHCSQGLVASLLPPSPAQ